MGIPMYPDAPRPPGMTGYQDGEWHVCDWRCSFWASPGFIVWGACGLAILLVWWKL